jgi:PhnB protein
MKAASPYLNFAGNTEEAFEFYKSVFGGEFTNVTRFRDFADNPMGVAEAELDKIANIGLPLGPNATLMGTDLLEAWGPLVAGNNFHIALETDTSDEADRLFDALSSEGTVHMSLQQTEWAEKYGDLTDRFGIRWMGMYTGSVRFAVDGQT